MDQEEKDMSSSHAPLDGNKKNPTLPPVDVKSDAKKDEKIDVLDLRIQLAETLSTTAQRFAFCPIQISRNELLDYKKIREKIAKSIETTFSLNEEVSQKELQPVRVRFSNNIQQEPLNFRPSRNVQPNEANQFNNGT